MPMELYELIEKELNIDQEIPFLKRIEAILPRGFIHTGSGGAGRVRKQSR